MKNHLILGTALCLAGSASFGAAPTYTFLRTVDFGTTASGSWKATTAKADADGMIYFTDNTTDEVAFFDPLTASVPGDVTQVYDPSGTPADPFGSSSFMGIGIDAAGVIYASGADTTAAPTEGNLLRITKTGPGAWTNEFITGLTGPFSGCDADPTQNGAVVVSNVTNGEVTGYTIPSDGTAATPVAAATPTGGIGDVIRVLEDTTTSRGYQSIALDNLAGRVDVTTTGTYDSSANPLIDPVASSFVKSDQELHYQQMSINTDDQVLCVSVNRGTVGAGNTFELYDLAQSGKGLTPYQTINGATTGGPLFGSTIRCYGTTFFNQGADKYLFVDVYRTGGQGGYIAEGYVFKQTDSSVDGWNLY